MVIAEVRERIIETEDELKAWLEWAEFNIKAVMAEQTLKKKKPKVFVNFAVWTSETVKPNPFLS